MSATRPKTSVPSAEAARATELSGEMSVAQLPLGLLRRDHDADREQIVSVGKETHAGAEHDLPPKPAHVNLVERAEPVRWSLSGVGRHAA